MAMAIDDLSELAFVSVDPASKVIKLVVSDIEGCLNLDERVYDFEALAWIRSANQQARPDNVMPFVTVCSGRQHAFVEAVIRMIGGDKPAIFENGCGLFFPTRNLYDEYEWHPSLIESKIASNHIKVRKAVELICAHTGAHRVIGKEFLISLHPAPQMSVVELYHLVTAKLADIGINASITASASAVDIAPMGINKGSGLRWLISKLNQELPLDLSNIAGIGDSKGDLPLLEIVGFSAAPANAAEEVKAIVKYCSSKTDGQGVIDIIRQCIAINFKRRQ